jgi:2Fe-2S iron-sulfur cluster binding domain
MPLKLNVNHELRTVDLPPDTPLLWALRDVLGLKGTKYGCGIGVCGACTVLADGRPVRSCMTQVGSVTGQDIHRRAFGRRHSPRAAGLGGGGRAPVRLLPARADSGGGGAAGPHFASR